MTTSPAASPSARPPRRRRIWFVLLGVILLALIAYIVVARIAYDTMSLYGSKALHAEATPDTPFEEVSFPTRGGSYPVYAFWQTTTKPDAPVIINVHGYGNSRYLDYVQTRAEIILGLGYNVLSLNLSDNGGKTVEDGRISMGYDEHGDVLGAYDYLLTKGYKPEQIGLVGESMGAATILLAAQAQPTLKIIWADSPFSDAPMVLREQAGALGFPGFIVDGSLIWAQVLSNDNLRAASPITAGAGFAANKQAVYLSTCTTDNIVNPHHARDLYAEYKAKGVDVQFWEIACTEHATGMEFARDEYFQRLDAFLSSHFSSQAS